MFGFNLGDQFNGFKSWWYGENKTLSPDDEPLKNELQKQSGYGLSYYAKQIGKGAIILGTGALAYFGFSSLFNKKEQKKFENIDGKFDEQSQNKLNVYKENIELNLNLIEARRKTIQAERRNINISSFHYTIGPSTFIAPYTSSGYQEPFAVDNFNNSVDFSNHLFAIH